MYGVVWNIIYRSNNINIIFPGKRTSTDMTPEEKDYSPMARSDIILRFCIIINRYPFLSV